MVVIKIPHVKRVFEIKKGTFWSGLLSETVPLGLGQNKKLMVMALVALRGESFFGHWWRGNDGVLIRVDP